MVEHDIAYAAAELEAALPDERERLVRLCAWFTGNVHVAEDLAQETLIEAWRNAHKLHDPAGRAQWLSAIARNVCLRWARAHGRELSRYAGPRPDEPAVLSLEERLQDPFDLEIELERHELVELLDRALALLPAETRTLLVEHYVKESPQAEVAARLGLTEGAVTMRLQRGKLLLRRILTTDLKEEAAAFGLHAPATGGFEETRIWCPICGQSRLDGRFDPTTRQLTLRCRRCTPEPPMSVVNGGDVTIFAGVHGYRAAFNRLAQLANDYFQQGLKLRTCPCPICGQSAPFEVHVYEDVPFAACKYGIHAACPACGHVDFSALFGVSLCLPEGRRFWRAHPRLRALPEAEVEVEGVPAIVTRCESIDGRARFDVVFRAETFEVMQIHGARHA